MCKNMCKKLLVFSLAFFLSLLSLQFFNLRNETISQKTTANLTIPDNSQTVQVIRPTSYNYVPSAIDCFQNFQTAVAENDKETVISLINFPIEVQFINKKNQPYYKIIKSENEFLSNYDKIFDDSFKIFISQRKTSQLLFSTSGEIFIWKSIIRMKPFYTNDSRSSEVKVISLNKYPSYQ